MLFLVYINDLDDNIISALFKFADDGKMLHSVSDKAEIDLVQNDLNKLATWSKDWQMPFNLDKCKVMHVGGNNQEYIYQLNNKVIASFELEKDLGV